MGTNVHLTPDLQAFVRACMRGGQYNNVSEVIRSGLRLLQEQQERKRAFDAMVAKVIDDVDSQGAREMDDVLRRVDAVIEAAER